jgi:hypothetical protein
MVYILLFFEKEILTEVPKYFPYGHVFPIIYRKYDKLQRLKIKNTDDNFNDTMEETLDIFGKISATKLSEWTHMEGSPWSYMQYRRSNYGDPLLVDDIKNYFTYFIAKYKGMQ